MSINRDHKIGLALLLILVVVANFADSTTWVSLIGIGISLVATLLMLLLASDGYRQRRKAIETLRKYGKHRE